MHLFQIMKARVLLFFNSLKSYILKPYNSLRKNCPYSELFYSAFSPIRTEYGEIRTVCPNSVQIRENAEQNNSKFGNFSQSDCLLKNAIFSIKTVNKYSESIVELKTKMKDLGNIDCLCILCR